MVKKTNKKTKKEDKKKEEKKEVKKNKKPQTMEALLEQTDYTFVVPKKGEIVEGVIKDKESQNLIVDIGAKTDGIVSSQDYDFARDFIDELHVGDKINAMVISGDNDRGQITLSLKNAATDAKWSFFQEALDEDKILEAKGLEVNKGGLIVSINGVRGFVPSSQFGRKYVGHINRLKGKTIEVKAIEVDREKNRLIFSERHVSEADELARRDNALKTVEIDGVYEGVVSGVMPFGLFVTVEIPIGEDAGKKAASKDDEEEKETDKKEKEEEKKKSKTKKEKAKKKKKERKSQDKKIGYIEGLIHISEISWEKVNHPRDYHKVGDRVKVKVLGIDDKTNKLNLSIKQLGVDPWSTIEEQYPEGTTFTGKVSRIEPFGVFVNVQTGVDGLIHATKLDPNHSFKIGDEVTVHVESVEPNNRRMSLSIVKAELPMGYK